MSHLSISWLKFTLGHYECSPSCQVYHLIWRRRVKTSREGKNLALVYLHWHLLRCPLSRLDLRCWSIHVAVVSFLDGTFSSSLFSSAYEGMKWPFCLPSGSVQGFLLPLVSFWTHIELFYFTQPHAGVHGNYVGCLWSSCPTPPIAFLFLKEIIGSCCFPGFT